MVVRPEEEEEEVKEEEISIGSGGEDGETPTEDGTESIDFTVL